MFDKYSNQERNLKICDSESADLSSPFKPTEVLDVIESVHEEPKTWPDSLDGHMIKGDGLNEPRIALPWLKPAALIYSSFGRFTIRTEPGKKMRILITPYTKAN
jgi:hypothetical protein